MASCLILLHHNKFCLLKSLLALDVELKSATVAIFLRIHPNDLEEDQFPGTLQYHLNHLNHPFKFALYNTLLAADCSRHDSL
jgi:hypothetical protein